ncbi:MAG: DUF58 domain-containing protein [Nostocoides sp.]
MATIVKLITSRGRSFLAAGAMVLFAGIVLGVVDLIRVGVLLLALPLAALVATHRHRLDLAVRRTAAPARIPLDQMSQIDIVMRNSSLTRTRTMMAEDLVDPALGRPTRFVLPSMPATAERVFRYPVRGTVRGRYQLGPMTVRVKDAFGLTQRAAHNTVTTGIVVLPRVLPLARSTTRGSEFGAEGSIPHRVALHGEDDVSIREYRSGDELRRVHWPATARTGHIMVRQEERPAIRRAVLLLDSRASIYPVQGSARPFEWAVSATASLAVHFLEAGYAVRLLTSSDDRRSDGRAATDLDPDAVLDTLAEISPSTDEASAWLLHTAPATTSAGGLVAAVLGPMDEVDARAVASLRTPGSTGIAIVIDPGESRPDRSRSPRWAANSTAVILASAGWLVTVARNGDAIGEVWRRIIDPAGRG